LLKIACSGPGVSRTLNLSVKSAILYHYTTAPIGASFQKKFSPRGEIGLSTGRYLCSPFHVYTHVFLRMYVYTASPLETADKVLFTVACVSFCLCNNNCPRLTLKAHPCVIARVLSNIPPRKFVKGSDLYRESQKKMYKKAHKHYISPICPAAPMDGYVR